MHEYRAVFISVLFFHFDWIESKKSISNGCDQSEKKIGFLSTEVIVARVTTTKTSIYLLCSSLQCTTISNICPTFSFFFVKSIRNFKYTISLSISISHSIGVSCFFFLISLDFEKCTQDMTWDLNSIDNWYRVHSISFLRSNK